MGSQGLKGASKKEGELVGGLGQMLHETQEKRGPSNFPSPGRNENKIEK